MKRTVSSGNLQFSDLLRENSGVWMNIILHESFYYIIRCHIIRMYKILIIKTVISQNIYNKFISRKIICPVKFTHQLMYHFNQPGLTAIVLNYSIADVAHRTYGKYYL